MRPPAPRLRWAVEQLAVQPDDRLLEIGCGHGVAVSLVGERLAGGSGTIVAVDRSPAMIAAARARNAAAVAAGVASFHVGTLDEAALGDARFDTVFAIHVGVFLRGDPARELAVVRERLAPGGRIALAWQPFTPDAAAGVIEALASRLARHRFDVVDTRVADLATGRNVCVLAAPAGRIE